MLRLDPLPSASAGESDWFHGATAVPGASAALSGANAPHAAAGAAAPTGRSGGAAATSAPSAALKAEMARLGVDRATARVVLAAKRMPEFSNATDADLLKAAAWIRNAAGFKSPGALADWYRKHPQWGEALRQLKIADSAIGAPGSKATASPVDSPGAGGGGSSGETVRFLITDAALFRDTTIFNAVEAFRNGALAPGVALFDSLKACAAFTVELGQRVACYSLVDSTDLKMVRELKPWLHTKGEPGTLEFDYVKRLVMDGESSASIIASRSTVLYEQSALPLRAMEVAEAALRPFGESPRDRLERRRLEECRRSEATEATRLGQSTNVSDPSGAGSRAERPTRAREDRQRPDRA